ncbi:Calcium-dependent protein kinase 12 [Porphyridium purpureum]|uniref:Calcium-dependent protein kinase 12 n=1 Tax=Porphyridium purpureum TaxID=35688 RepID=A0A5J4YKU2_PORPP|nr:Calcium-dependent protein kinase 12 [Porphyridium purpureum]|eukprot:POR5889..scf291_13
MGDEPCEYQILEGTLKVVQGGAGRKLERYVALHGSLMVVSKTPASKKVDREFVVGNVRAGGKPLELVVTSVGKEFSCTLHCDNSNEHNQWFSALDVAKDRHFEKHFSQGMVIGEGTFATVKMCYRASDKQVFAVKLVSKQRADAEEIKLIRREVSCHQRVSGHPNVVQMVDVFEDKEYLYVVLEYMMKDLFDMQTDKGTFNERETMQIMHDLLTSLKFCHERLVVHRDVKPENLFCTRERWPARIKLADFGLGRFFDEGTDWGNMSSFVGTNEYAAPEVIRQKPYGCGCDVWSAGVIMFELLTGRKPFAGATEAELLKNVCEAPVDMQDRKIVNLSNSGKSLLLGLLHKNQFKRLSALGALNHEWFSEEVALPALDMVRRTNPLSRLRSVAFAVQFANYISSFKATDPFLSPTSLDEGSRSPQVASQRWNGKSPLDSSSGARRSASPRKIKSRLSDDSVLSGGSHAVTKGVSDVSVDDDASRVSSSAKKKSGEKLPKKVLSSLHSLMASAGKGSGKLDRQKSKKRQVQRLPSLRNFNVDSDD